MNQKVLYKRLYSCHDKPEGTVFEMLIITKNEVTLNTRTQINTSIGC